MLLTIYNLPYKGNEKTQQLSELPYNSANLTSSNFNV